MEEAREYSAVTNRSMEVDLLVMYEARTICNFLLAEKQAGDIELTNLRINKLIYFIHAWSLLNDQPGIVRNHFEAWPRGPVVRSVYNAFAKFGYDEITEYAKYLDYTDGEQKIIPWDNIERMHAKKIICIYESYKIFSTQDLVDLSHVPGGPWWHVWRNRPSGSSCGGRIPDELVKAHFASGGCGKHN